MKEKTIFLFIIQLSIVFKKSFQQPIIIPINPIQDDNDNQEGVQQIIETKQLQDENGNNITITRIHFHRTKNLNGDSKKVTPIQIIRTFDDRVNSIFEDIIRQSLGIKLILNSLSMIDNEENEIENKNKSAKKEKDIFDEFFEDDEEEEEVKDKNKTDNNNDTIKNNNIQNNIIKNEIKEKRILKKEKDEKMKKTGKLKTNMDNIKNMLKKNKKKLSRKELIFSRVCKYIFYSIILFTIYILVKKALEVLDIIDPDNAVEVKIENDESSKLKKTTDEKQN